MSEQEYLDTFTQTLRDLLFDDSIVLTMDTTRADIPDWDSFAYINFIVALEMRYSIKFSVAEVESFQNVGEIVTRTDQLANG